MYIGCPYYNKGCPYSDMGTEFGHHRWWSTVIYGIKIFNKILKSQ